MVGELDMIRFGFAMVGIGENIEDSHELGYGLDRSMDFWNFGRDILRDIFLVGRNLLPWDHTLAYHPSCRFLKHGVHHWSLIIAELGVGATILVLDHMGWSSGSMMVIGGESGGVLTFSSNMLILDVTMKSSLMNGCLPNEDVFMLGMVVPRHKEVNLGPKGHKGAGNVWAALGETGDRISRRQEKPVEGEAGGRRSWWQEKPAAGEAGGRRSRRQGKLTTGEAGGRRSQWH
ncbi:hypothetical protein Tco_0700285 [Tanacetum coccineum]